MEEFRPSKSLEAGFTAQVAQGLQRSTSIRCVSLSDSQLIKADLLVLALPHLALQPADCLSGMQSSYVCENCRHGHMGEDATGAVHVTSASSHSQARRQGHRCTQPDVCLCCSPSAVQAYLCSTLAVSTSQPKRPGQGTRCGLMECRAWGSC